MLWFISLNYNEQPIGFCICWQISIKTCDMIIIQLCLLSSSQHSLTQYTHTVILFISSPFIYHIKAIGYVYQLFSTKIHNTQAYLTIQSASWSRQMESTENVVRDFIMATGETLSRLSVTPTCTHLSEKRILTQPQSSCAEGRTVCVG